VEARKLDGFGVSYVVVPDGSRAAVYFSGDVRAIHIESDTVYQIPNAVLHPYVALNIK